MRRDHQQIGVCEKGLCCGCGSCEQKCPNRCITMITDEEGFQYPSINKLECLHCGKCKDACPIINVTKIGIRKQRIFAAYSIDESTRLNSSSGGIFSLLAEEILKQGGVVFGASFDSKWMVHHVRVEKTTELSTLRGSKYVQSNIGNTYAEAEMLLKQGRKVLFSGTGCQIAGLKQFLQTDYPNCYTVDILCHGVPSPLVWEKYLHEKENQLGAHINEIYFRNKANGWNSYMIRILFDNSKEYAKQHNEDVYMRLFLENIDLRPSCHNCSFKSIERLSDLTLGDAWGIESVMQGFADDKGTSLVIVQSKKGQELLDTIHDRVYLKEGNIDDLLPVQADSRNSMKKHANRELFFRELMRTESIEQMEKHLHFSIPRRVFLKIKRTLGSIN